MDQIFQEFLQNKPCAGELRELHPGIEHLLVGEFRRNDPNKYPPEDPVVGSWELDQGIYKNPTYGMFSAQEEPHVFPTGDYIEKLVILNGFFKTENEMKVIPGNYVMITAEDVLNLTALSNVTYLCMYELKK